MNEQELRILVREAIERHLPPGARADATPPVRASHASHILLKVVTGSELDGGVCLIEPAVACNHCGFCQSYGH